MQVQLPPSLNELFQIKSLPRFREVLRPPQAQSTARRNQNYSGSLSKSPRFETFANSGNAASFAPSSVVNRRDALGRTVLMLAVTSKDVNALKYVKLLLECPTININWQDFESGWTALHRALYHGNLPAARLLMARSDLDSRIKDFEGLTAIDLFNSTIDGTNPDSDNCGAFELFTWGSNRNFVLGVPGDGHRPYPERVSLKARDQNRKKDVSEAIGVTDFAMSKLHTGIVTTESSGNARFCGYGGNARLGTSSKTQFAFESLPDFPHKVAQIAIGLDHTVILTTTGDVYTYGLNHHAQLGYPIEAPTSKTNQPEEPMQLTPRKVAALKKEVVKGIAASRYHTAIFTNDALWTWGAQRGQLGYGSGPTQALPRQVAAIQTPVIQLVATDHATVCLLESSEVIALFRGVSFKMAFPMSRFPASMQVYRPPSAKISIRKIAGGGGDLVAVSTIGDVFHWTLDDSVIDTAQASRSATRLWDLRRKFTAVIDASVSNESIILCTRSGHIFVRQRRADTVQPVKGAELKISAGASSSRRNFKFSRLYSIQRAIKVCANGYGGFAAIRADVRIPPISIEGSSIGMDLLNMLPHSSRRDISSRPLLTTSDLDEDGIGHDFEQTLSLLELARNWDQSSEEPANGTDMFLFVEKRVIPVHSLILATRSPIFAAILSGKSQNTGFTYDRKSRRLTISKSNFLSCLLLLQYLYSEDFPCIWDPRIAFGLQNFSPRPAIGVIRDELQRLAHVLHLPALGKACGSAEKMELAATPFVDAIASLYSPTIQTSDSPRRNVILKLKDGDIACHSLVLRARCSFFAALLDDPEWTIERQEHIGDSVLLQVDVRHIPAELMHPVLSYIYSGRSSDALLSKENDSVDSRIDFLTAVLAVANEFLLDELRLMCSELLRPLIDMRTVSAILSDAMMYEAGQLTDACCYYMLCNMETLLEGDYLADLEPALVERLAVYCQARQVSKQPTTRTDSLVKVLLEKHADWLEQQDLAKPPTGISRRIRIYQKSPRLSPSEMPSSPPFVSLKSPLSHTASSKGKQSRSPEPSPSLNPIDEAIFTIDDLDLNVPVEIATTPTKVMWSARQPSTSTSKPSLRDIMASQTAVKPKVMPRTTSQASPITPLTALSNAIKARESSSPSWRKFDASKVSLNSIQSEQAVPQRQTGFTSSATAPPKNSAKSVTPARTPVRVADPTSAVGVPVISPTKGASMSPVAMRNRLPGQDGAWVNYTSTNSFFVPESTSPADRSGFSFAAIQNAQRDEGESIRNAKKAPKSLIDIQQEAAFEAWFEEEQRKFMRAAEVAEKRASPAKSSRGRGRGRGKSSKTGPAQSSHV